MKCGAWSNHRAASVPSRRLRKIRRLNNKATGGRSWGADAHCRSNVCLRRHLTICPVVTHQPGDFPSVEFSEQSYKPWATPLMGESLSDTTRSWGAGASQDVRGCLVYLVCPVCIVGLVRRTKETKKPDRQVLQPVRCSSTMGRSHRFGLYTSEIHIGILSPSTGTRSSFTPSPI
jgi:hypothetical protein